MSSVLVSPRACPCRLTGPVAFASVTRQHNRSMTTFLLLKSCRVLQSIYSNLNAMHNKQYTAGVQFLISNQNLFQDKLVVRSGL